MVEETVAQVSATDLKPGMWIDRDGPTEVLLAQTFTDENGPGVYITHRGIGGGIDSLPADTTEAFDLVPNSRVEELQRLARRNEEIAQLQALAKWLQDNPWVPMPNMPHQIDLHGDDGYVTLLKLAARLDVPVDERATSRTEVTFKAAGVRLEVIAWHAQGRPQLAVDPDPRGLAYTRADSEADDPTPVSPARVPMHTGGMTAEGLVDETRGWTDLTTDEQRAAVGLVDETPAEAVTVYFSFGHGQTDPGTGKDLLNHYVTVIGPSYGACREAMFASRFGQAWAFDYLAGTPQADEWIPQWTEHERFEVS